MKDLMIWIDNHEALGTVILLTVGAVFYGVGIVLTLLRRKKRRKAETPDKCRVISGLEKKR